MGGRLAERAALAAGVGVTLLVLVALARGAGGAERDVAALGAPLATSLLVSAWGLLAASAVGIPAAVWMELHPRLGRLLGAVVDAAGSLPSVLAGLIGLEIFVGAFHLGFSQLAGGLTLGLLNLPFIIRGTVGAIQASGVGLEGGLALGIPAEIVFWRLAWPEVEPGLRGVAVEAAARSMGETAALYLTVGFGGAGFGLDPLSAHTTLSLRLFYLLIQGRGGLQGLTSAVAFSMMAVGMGLHLAARYGRPRRPALDGSQN